MDDSGQKQIRFRCVYQLRSAILFAFAQKRPIFWVTITVFDTGRDTPYMCHYGGS